MIHDTPCVDRPSFQLDLSVYSFLRASPGIWSILDWYGLLKGLHYNVAPMHIEAVEVCRRMHGGGPCHKTREVTGSWIITYRAHHSMIESSMSVHSCVSSLGQ